MLLLLNKKQDFYIVNEFVVAKFKLFYCEIVAAHDHCTIAIAQSRFV